jgi:predicted RNA-binding Zn ribbon-like protein
LLYERYIRIIEIARVIVKVNFEGYDLESSAIDLLNSDWSDYLGSGRREDRILNQAWMKSFVAKWGFEAAGAPSRRQIAELTSLRSTMRSIVETLVRHEEPADADLVALNAQLAASATRREIVRDGSGFRIEYAPAGRDWNWVRSEIATSFAELLTGRDTRRIKMCENDNCRWVFCDESKSRTRRWCEDTCGNLVKVRRFRRRKRSETNYPST